MIRNSLELAGVDPKDVGVRLRFAGGAVRSRFAPGPDAGDEVVEIEGIRVFVASSIVAEHGPDLVVDVSAEHDQLIVTS